MIGFHYIMTITGACTASDLAILKCLNNLQDAHRPFLPFGTSVQQHQSISDAAILSDTHTSSLPSYKMHTAPHAPCKCMGTRGLLGNVAQQASHGTGVGCAPTRIRQLSEACIAYSSVKSNAGVHVQSNSSKLTPAVYDTHAVVL